ncbi:hypothetical protein IP90_00123 [Luteimonas cucumeris]|uniref:Uncharacterized protein n=1 Tax=Luteimonas cucumeris TaxID=985012 RepID=A0A562LDY3_9GAMM|nr:hypothetical protein [Luteimonas cucumeris]TWI05861.1 hypothetical protein IP90_00123 [Luteimonas cucumeris]
MFQYRVTKYNPADRDAHGAYTRDEWNSVNDVGRAFDGVPLTETEYLRVESAYITVALEFLRESKVTSLAVSGLENHDEAALPFDEGTRLSVGQVGAMLGGLLQERFWCKLEGASSFIHVGYDYYMYVGVPVACPKAAELAVSIGLFVEPFQSPYSAVAAA